VARELFVDTSAWYPIVVQRHPDHIACATALLDAVSGGVRIVTTNLILAETYVLLSRRVRRETALVFIRTVREPPNLVIASDPDLEIAAVNDWLEPFEDQDFSFADAVSFAVMKLRGIERALTLDHHFVVAGFSVIPH
jgi:predicted nucleic acid-binding protein